MLNVIKFMHFCIHFGNRQREGERERKKERKIERENNGEEKNRERELTNSPYSRDLHI